tara:strand:- start:232 stop:408 length:177 start_codon:yes stop_codon:yes gene_type:complete
MYLNDAIIHTDTSEEIKSQSSKNEFYKFLERNERTFLNSPKSSQSSETPEKIDENVKY